MPRVIFHVDMDAFFAAIEQRDNPCYRGRPIIVGAPPDQRGDVCAASYEARKFKVRSAMPSRTAARLCPEGTFVRPRMDAYRAESARIMAILRETSPRMEQISVDEAYVDLSGLVEGAEPDEALRAAAPIAQGIKARISRECGLTASIGIGSNKFLAKLGSDFKKPDGLTIIPEAEKIAFLRPLPADSIPGVGPVTSHALRESGIVTIGDIQDTARDLQPVVGSFATTLKERAFGRDDRPLDMSGERKSISSETTFPSDTAHRPTLRSALDELARDVAKCLAENETGAMTVQVKVRYGDFRTITRQVRVEEPLTEAKEIYRLACFLLARDRLVSRPLRLLGICASTLAPRSPQLRLPI